MSRRPLRVTVICDASPLLFRIVNSAVVTDNTELILIREAMDLLLPKLAKVIKVSSPRFSFLT